MSSGKRAQQHPEPGPLAAPDADFPELAPLTVRLVILSRGRPKTMTSHRLFPSATLLVPESESSAYAQACRTLDKPTTFALRDLETIPDDVRGISAVRNWIVRKFNRSDEDVVVMIDDDIKDCVALVSLRCRKLSPVEIEVMISNTVHCAHGAGARILGWHQRSDPKLLQRNDPFGLHHWVGGVVGVIGKEPRWDELLRCKCDIDACLTEFLERRIVWQDARFCFVQERDKNLGGNSLFRSEDRIALEKRHLKRKWQGHIRFENYKSQERVAIDVQRRQPVSLI